MTTFPPFNTPIQKWKGSKRVSHSLELLKKCIENIFGKGENFNTFGHNSPPPPLIRIDPRSKFHLILPTPVRSGCGRNIESYIIWLMVRGNGDAD